MWRIVRAWHTITAFEARGIQRAIGLVGVSKAGIFAPAAAAPRWSKCAFLRRRRRRRRRIVGMAFQKVSLAAFV